MKIKKEKLNVFYSESLYKIGERFYGWNVFERLHQLQDMENWSAEQVNEWQLNNLKKIVYHAYQNVPVYRNLWKKADVHPGDIKFLTDLSNFPIINKKHLRDAGDLALDQQYPKNKYLQGRTSGSTGERFVYYKTKSHYSWFMASHFLGWKWTGWDIGKPWIRLQFRGKLSLRQRIDDRIFNCLYMPIDKLSHHYMEKFLYKTKYFNPVMLRGYTDGTYVFAKYLLENQNKLIRPLAIVCTGSTLYPHYLETIKEAFGNLIFDNYGGEGLNIANQCENGAYHILPTVYVEIEPDGPIWEEGQSGRIIITSLTNYAMPMIRYDIADIGIMGQGSCSCGRSWSHFKKIIGRDTDIVITPSGHYLVCHHFNNILREFDGIDQFQVIQEELKEVNIRLVTNDKYNQKIHESNIIKLLSEIGGEGFSINIEYKDTIELHPSGKRRYIISKEFQNKYLD